MEFYRTSVFHLLLIISSLLFSTSTADGGGSVFFTDGRAGQYIRTPPTNHAVQSHSMSLVEVGAAVSVLLGFAPPATLSAAGSSKLNEVLMPNPFDRPRAVFLLEIKGIRELPANAMFTDAFKSKVFLGSDKAHIQLPGEGVSMVSLDEAVPDITDKHISDFASWFGASYVVDSTETMNGELSIPLATGAIVTFHMSKKADRDFIGSLVALLLNGRRAMEMHEDLSQNPERLAELLKGSFGGIEAFQRHYGSDVVAQEGLELLLAMVSKLIDSLQAAYKGQIVGIILFNAMPAPGSEAMMNVMLTSRPSARWLAESEGSSNATIAEVALVRTTLAWLTGVILLIATLLGIYLLLNMPLTRDTLLYSNVKLD